MKPPRSRSLGLLARLKVPTLLGPARGHRTPLTAVGVRAVPATLAGRYEREQSRFIVERLAGASTFVDVGAAEGHFVRLACRAMPPGTTIVAFEPDPARRRLLEAAVELRCAARVQVRPEALGAEDAAGHLIVGERMSARLAGVAAGSPATNGADAVTVRSVDSLVGSGELAPPDVVKIDTEGAELSVLAGMSRTIAERRPALVVECHSMPLLRDVLSVVLDGGYAVVRVTRGGDHVGPPSVLASP